MKLTTFVAGLLVAISAQGLATPTVSDVEGLDLKSRQVSANDIRQAADMEKRNHWGNGGQWGNGGGQWGWPKPSPTPKKKKCGVVGYAPRYATGYYATILPPAKCALRCERDYKCNNFSLKPIHDGRDGKFICKLYRRKEIIQDVTNPDGRASTLFFCKDCPRPRLDGNGQVRW